MQCPPPFPTSSSMERHRDARGTPPGSGAVSTTRSPRTIGLKDSSVLVDEDDFVDDVSDSRSRDRHNKDRTSPTSGHVSVSPNVRKKKRRPGPNEARTQKHSSIGDEADERSEETEIAVSEDDDEPPAPPIYRRAGKSRANGKLEDEFVADFPTVPRKARSAMLKRPQESIVSNASCQQGLTIADSMLSGISVVKSGSRLKPDGVKLRPMKVLKVSTQSAASEQEVEVAEALFDLARSIVSPLMVTESQSESKSESTPEAEAEAEAEVEALISISPPPRTPAGAHLPSTQPTSSSAITCVPTTGSSISGFFSSQVHAGAHSVTSPSAEAPKRKRPRVPRVEDVEDGTQVQVMEATGAVNLSISNDVLCAPFAKTELAKALRTSQAIRTGSFSLQSQPILGIRAMDPISTLSTQLHIDKEGKFKTKVDKNDAKIEIRRSATRKENASSLIDCLNSLVLNSSSVKPDASVDVTMTNDALTNLELYRRAARSSNGDCPSPSSCIDLMFPPSKLSVKERELSLPASSNVLPDKSFINLKNFPGNSFNGESARLCEEPMGIKTVGNKENSEDKESNDFNEEGKEKDNGQDQKSKKDSEMQKDYSMEGESEERDFVLHTSQSTSKSQKCEAVMLKPDKSGSPAISSLVGSKLQIFGSSTIEEVLSGCLPSPGCSGSAAASILEPSSLDGKATHQAVQQPQAFVLRPMPRFKRCAAHVYVAHLIHLEQQLSRSSLWPATFCKGTQYNLNYVPINPQDKEKSSGINVLSRKSHLTQSEPPHGFPVFQSTGKGVAESNGTVGGTVTSGSEVQGASNSATVGVSETATGNVMSLAAHPQYIQAIIQNGFAPFSFPNAHFLGPPLHGLNQQAAQYFNSPFYATHLVPQTPQFQSLAQQTPSLFSSDKQQERLQTSAQLSVQSPSICQQQYQNGISKPQQSCHNEREINTAVEIGSTAENMLPLLPRSMYNQSSSNLSIQNINTSMAFGANVAPLPVHSQNFSLVASIEGTQAIKTEKSQLNGHLQAHQSAPLSSCSQQLKQYQRIAKRPGIGLELEMNLKDLGASGPCPCSPMSMGNLNQGSDRHGAIVITPQDQAMLQGMAAAVGLHAQQQCCAGQNMQQQQGSVLRTITSTEKDGYIRNNSRGHEFKEDQKMPLRYGVGQPVSLTRINQTSLPDMQLSASSGGGVTHAVQLPTNTAPTFGLMNTAGNRNYQPVVCSSRDDETVPDRSANRSSKQMALSHIKTTASPNLTSAAIAIPQAVPPLADTVSLPAIVRNIPRPALSFLGKMVPCSQNLKQGEASLGQLTPGVYAESADGASVQSVLNAAIAKNKGQQALNQQGRLPSAVSASQSSRMTLASPHSRPVSKLVSASDSKDAASGKASVPTLKSGVVSAKRSAPDSATTLSSTLGLSQSTSANSSQHLQTQVSLGLPQSSQRHITAVTQQQQLETKNLLYHQEHPLQGSHYENSQLEQQLRAQIFFQQHPHHYMQHTQQQPQALLQMRQKQSSNHFQQSAQHSANQHTPIHQQPMHGPHHSHGEGLVESLSSSSSRTWIKSGLSLGTPTMHACGNTSSDGAEEFQGVDRRNKLSFTGTTNHCRPLTGGRLQEVILSGHPSNALQSGYQVSSVNGGASHFLGLASSVGVKSLEQNPLHYSVNQEQVNGMCILPNSSSIQPPFIPTPASS